jgi:hypothetical protein
MAEPLPRQSDDAVRYWHDQFQYALSGLSWAVGALGENAGYAGKVHERLTNPVLYIPPMETTSDAS